MITTETKSEEFNTDLPRLMVWTLGSDQEKDWIYGIVCKDGPNLRFTSLLKGDSWIMNQTNNDYKTLPKNFSIKLYNK